MTRPDPLQAALHREHLLRYARRRLRDAALAEDLVHDVLATVCEGRAHFEQRSSLRTWLIGILKHKIVDAVRRRAGECSFDALTDESEAPPALTLHAPEGDEPARRAEQRQHLHAVFERLATQPPTLQRTFELYALWGEDAAEVCAALSITPSNLWVRMHRVRTALADLRPLAVS